MKNNHQTLNYDLSFSGYWSGLDVGNVPAEAGVYCAYAFTPGSAVAEGEETVPERILFVGDTLNARAMIARHEAMGDLEAYLTEGERVCYSFAPILFGREQAKAALIYRHKPIGNFRYKFTFPYEPTRVRLRGSIYRLNADFVVPELGDRDVEHLFSVFDLPESA